MWKLKPLKESWKCLVILYVTLVLCSTVLNPIASAQDRMSEQADPDAKKYKACNDGPDMLKATDNWERQNNRLALITINHESMKPEAAAELFIADCSRDLSLLSGMAAASDDAAPMRMMRSVWKENLEFMKWWLQNRRQKIE